MKRTQVKMCGITRPEDGVAAVAAGADAIGLVFYDLSPRAVTIAEARAICRELPPFVTVVALTVDAPPPQVEEILAHLPIDLLQFHGDESPQQCESFGRHYLKALRMRPGLDLANEIARYSSARGILLDAYRAGVPGGTGESFDWSLIAAQFRPSIILAGGLTVANVGAAIAAVHPLAVDVSGGIESAPGIKDRTKMQEFMRNVNLADAACAL